VHHVPEHGSIPEDPRETRQGLHRFPQMLVDLRDAVHEQMQGYKSQREVAVRQTYREMMGTLK